MRYCIDASSWIHLWNEAYPQNIFPSLYPKLEDISDNIVFIGPIQDEIKQEVELLKWIEKDMNLTSQKLQDHHRTEAHRLGSNYKIKKTSKGAGETDMKLISFAKIEECAVVTQEEKQNISPDQLYNFKIPLICKKENVPCINFLEFLQKNNIIV